MKHGLVRGALMRADEGTQGFRHGEGEEEVRPGQLFIQVVCEPLLGFMLLTLGAVAVPTGMVHAVVSATGVALIQAVTVVSTAAVLDGADDLAECEGQLGVALQVFWSKSSKDLAEGGHDRSLPF